MKPLWQRAGRGIGGAADNVHRTMCIGMIGRDDKDADK